MIKILRYAAELFWPPNLAQRSGREKYSDHMSAVIRQYAEILSRWSEANRSSGNRFQDAIGTEQMAIANVLDCIADGKPVIIFDKVHEDG